MKLQKNLTNKLHCKIPKLKSQQKTQIKISKENINQNFTPLPKPQKLQKLLIYLVTTLKLYIQLLYIYLVIIYLGTISFIYLVIILELFSFFFRSKGKLVYLFLLGLFKF